MFKANSLATVNGANNILNVSRTETSCCGAYTGPEARYSTTTNFGTDVASVTVAGTVYPFAANANDAASLKTQLKAALVAANMMDVENDGIRLATVGANTTAHIYADTVIDQLTDTGGGALAITAATTHYWACNFYTNIVGDPGTVTFNGGTPQNLANTPYAWTDNNVAANQAVATQLETDYAAALVAGGFAGATAAVTVDPASKSYRVVVVSDHANTIEIGYGQMSKDGNCRNEYR